MAGVQGRGALFHHVQRMDSERGQVRGSRLHLRHAVHRVHRDRHRGARQHRHRAVHDRGRTAAPSAARRSMSSTSSRRSRRSCTGCGACSSSRPWVAPKYQSVADSIGQLPLLGHIFGPPVSGGRGFMTAGLILAVMITPIITSLTRETLATVAQDDKNAALGMGATRWEMLRGDGVSASSRRHRRRRDARSRARDG